MGKKRRAMRERVTIQSPVYEQDEYGQLVLKPGSEYQDVAVGLPASWEHTGGSESFRGRQIQANIVGVFEIRLPRGFSISPTDRVVHLNDGNTAYEIYSARPCETALEGGFKYMEVFVKAVA